MTIRTAMHESPEPFTHLEISGNPAKWFQGHNLFGSNDLHALALALLHDLVQRHPYMTPLPSDFEAWSTGDCRLTRTDLTESLMLGCLAECLAWLRSAEQTAHLAHRGRGQLVKGSTLYFGKNSRRWALKIYAKGQEIRAKGHQQKSLLDLPHAQAWADRVLRAELTLRSMELKRLGLSRLSDWTLRDGVESVTAQLLFDKLGTLTMTTKSSLSQEILDTLKPSLRCVVAAWEAGTDLRSTLPARTFYRHRKELLPHGIDIATRLPKELSNIVPLHRVLEAKHVGVPDWADGTPLYFEPPIVKAG